MKSEPYVIHNEDALLVLASMPDESIDSIVTDPPYEISFMGRSWDSTGIAYNIDLWAECLRVLKPGGHLLSFGATRSYHRMTVAIEDAGFEIRDSIHWTYGSGFPKSLDVSKAIDKAAGAERKVVGSKRVTPKEIKTAEQRTDSAAGAFGGEAKDVPLTAPATDDAKSWAGWGTALKPSHEPIVVARKPLAGTVAQNVLAYGTGGLNIDGTRVGRLEGDVSTGGFGNAGIGMSEVGQDGDAGKGAEWVQSSQGRWPANTLLTHAAGCRKTGETTETTSGSGSPHPDTVFALGHKGNGGNKGQATVPLYACVQGCPVAVLDRQSGESKSQGGRIGKKEASTVTNVPAGQFEAGDPGYGDTGGASRFFTQTEWDETPFIYQAKPSKKERNAGLDGLPSKTHQFGNQKQPVESGSVNDKFRTNPSSNHHPTVKPVALMQHLVRLVTPPNGVVLDPFTGSGTTGVAALLEGKRFIGIEMTAEYLPIIEGRLQHAEQTVREKEEEQTPTLFDDGKVT